MNCNATASNEPWRSFFTLHFLPALLIPITLSAAEPETFFESKVRPILIEHCVACHGAKKQEAGLRLDSAEGLRKGSENGPVVVPGEVEQSKLIAAIRQSGSIKMPPKGKLSNPAIEALTMWVKRGANWPKDAGNLGDSDSIQQRSKTHWAFQPVTKPTVPELKSQISNLKSQIHTEVDAFVLARLEAAGLKPSPSADRRTLIRRATFDLHGCLRRRTRSRRLKRMSRPTLSIRL